MNRKTKTLLYNNVPEYKAKWVLDTIKLGWELPPHAPCSADLAPSDYYLFLLMGYALTEQHFDSYAEVENWISDWVASKDKHFFFHLIINLSGILYEIHSNC